MEQAEPTRIDILGARLKRLRSRPLLAGRLTFTEWTLDPSGDDFIASLGKLIAAAYVPADMRWKYPGSAVSDHLPEQGTPPKGGKPRKGDFGELVAGALYSTQMGQAVPFQRLGNKPIKGATLQGADLLALTLEHGEAPVPTIVEVKYRDKATATQLDDIKGSLDGADQSYLVSAWAAGVQLMERHPDVKKAFALSAAQSLAKMSKRDEPTPDHVRHAVIITGHSTIVPTWIEKKWGTSPPVSHLHVIVVENLADTMNGAYTYAAGLTYADASASVPAMLESLELRPGIAAAVSSLEARSVARTAPVELDALKEAALWLLADWAGMGVARATRIADASANPEVRGLALLLAGRGGLAQRELVSSPELLEFARVVRQAWNLNVSQGDLQAATRAAAQRLDEPDLAETLLLAGAAISYRLDRHPVALTRAAQSEGPGVEHVISRMQRRNIQAFWPSQARAISGGLLDPACPSVVIKMPTSAGKTALMELLVADALDRDPTAVVAVLAPTKALVSQLTMGFRASLLNAAVVRSSHGGLDFDTEDPGADGILIGPGVAVLTPERFDLEWRRAATGDDNSDTSKLQLLIVDEAHLLIEERRGDRLELVVARALRRGIRVVLLSSQFPETSTIAAWIGGTALESEWTPTWLRRSVYYRSDPSTGVVQEEVGEPVSCVDLDKKADAATAGTCAPDRPDETVEIAASLLPEGLVIVYSDLKKYIPKLSAAAAVRFPVQYPLDERLEELVILVAASDPEYADLLRAGIGVHHAGVPRHVRLAVESAARKNLLRIIICTSTLLEGVDFPAHTVVAAYPPRTGGRPNIARLRNLAGRAGRGGRFTYGSLVVMNFKEEDAAKWLDAFRRQLPATKSTLTRALDWLTYNAQHSGLLNVGAGGPAQVASLDAMILAAIAEGGVTDGDLREALEAVLGRTLWATGVQAARRDFLLDRAVERSERVRAAVGGGAWNAAFYRVGLPLASSVALRAAVQPHAAQLAAAVDDFGADMTEWLLWLAWKVAPAAPELAAWAVHADDDLLRAVKLWLEGEPISVIEDSFPDVWKDIAKDLESLLPWVITGAIEFAATEVGRTDLRLSAHQRLAPARLRYGVPHADLCEYVRGGLDRVAVVGYYNDYCEHVVAGQMRDIFETYLQERAAEDAARLLADARAAEAARTADGPPDAHNDADAAGQAEAPATAGPPS